MGMIRSNLEFFLNSALKLVESRILTWKDLYSTVLSPEEQKEALRIATGIKGNSTSKILGSLLFVQGQINDPKNIPAEIIKYQWEVYNSFVDSVSRSRFSQGALADSAFDAAHYAEWIVHWLDSMAACRCLESKMAIDLLKTPVPYIKRFTRVEYENLERKRYQTVSKNLTKEKFSELILEQILKPDFSFEYKKMAVEVLSSVLNSEDRKVFAEKFKISIVKKPMDSPEKVFEFFETDGEVRREIVKLLNPNDPQLFDYLLDIYINQKVESKVPPLAALETLTELNTGNEKLRRELVRRLSFISAGDTVAAFQALVRLFPTDSKSIVDTIYLYGDSKSESVIDKTVEMIKVLARESVRNPEILNALDKWFTSGSSQLTNVKFMGLPLNVLIRNIFNEQNKIQCRKVYKPQVKL
jgi:hypothetical protein